RSELKRGLILSRLNLARAAAHDPDKRAGEDRQQRDRADGDEQSHPGHVLKNLSLQERAAGIFRDLIEPFAVISAGVINSRAIYGRSLRGQVRDRFRDRWGRGLRRGRVWLSCECVDAT